MNKSKTALILFPTIILGMAFRLFGINWDSGYHMHPDERAIILSVVELQYPTSLSEFFSIDSPWNPQFFAYGSFPFYLLRVTGDLMGFINQTYAEYDGINLVGRILSALFDMGTIILIYFLGKHLFNRRVGLLSSFIYSASILPIQLSHFYAVDTPLTFFTVATLLTLLLFYEKPTFIKAALIGVFIGIALATKISATILLSSFGLSLLLEFSLIFLRAPLRFSHWSVHITPTIKRIAIYGTTTCITTFFVFLFFEPYAVIDFDRFSTQLIEQSHMTKNAFTFPYTLQYVGKVPYLYELKNIFFYGAGPFVTLLGIGGFIYILYRAIFREGHFPWEKSIIILQFFITYFLVTGSFAIGFMRYMLPIYPLLSIFAGLSASTLLVRLYKRNAKLGILAVIFFIFFLIAPALSFLSIYSRPNTRVQATEWILQRIPNGSTIATEHWDDVVPISGQQNYHMISLPLYEPDMMEKWQTINTIVKESDYIIVASNRLSTPLTKLTDCQNLPTNRCYLRTSLYYKELFDGSMGYKKVAEFNSYPTLPFTSLSLNDQEADESFTVYDHPKIMIFKNTRKQ